VATARLGEPQSDRVLPGSSMPLLEASIYARTTGYLRERRVDIGEQVKEGQVLAVISAPDIDDQLAQAQANLAQAKATLKLNEASLRLARVTLRRSQVARNSNLGAVTAQEIDQEEAAVQTGTASVETAKAAVRVNEAAVQRYTDLQSFQRITAPFPGVITARHVDKGDLVTADNPSMTKELFHLMRTDVLRVLVDVPQVFATGVKVGQEVTVYRREEPAREFKGKVARTANALDPATRTLRTEVEVPNPEQALRPGMYLQAKFVFRREVPTVLVPAAALATRTGAARVAVLDAGHKVHYRQVELGRDFGSEVEVLSGLKADETVLIHAGDDLAEGTAVEPVEMPRS
jgi:RND family efflux transporter MFP subunit